METLKEEILQLEGLRQNNVISDKDFEVTKQKLLDMYINKKRQRQETETVVENPEGDKKKVENTTSGAGPLKRPKPVPYGQPAPKGACFFHFSFL